MASTRTTQDGINEDYTRWTTTSKRTFTKLTTILIKIKLSTFLFMQKRFGIKLFLNAVYLFKLSATRYRSTLNNTEAGGCIAQKTNFAYVRFFREEDTLVGLVLERLLEVLQPLLQLVLLGRRRGQQLTVVLQLRREQS